jgi:hypothetical protein
VKSVLDGAAEFSEWKSSRQYRFGQEETVPEDRIRGESSVAVAVKMEQFGNPGRGTSAVGSRYCVNWK